MGRRLPSRLRRLGLLLGIAVVFLGAEELGRAASDGPSILRLPAPALSVPFPGRLVSHAIAPLDGRVYVLRENAVGLPLLRESTGRLEEAFPAETTARLFSFAPDGRVYVIDRASKLHVYTPAGHDLASFRVAPRPAALAVLSTGEVVIGAPANGKLMHVFSPAGRWLRSFGDMKSFDASDAQNRRLSEGLVLTGSNDEIVYVFRYAPEATVLRFSPSGALLTDFVVTGPEIDMRLAGVRNLMANRGSLDLSVAAMDVITAAALDQEGRLWVGMNASTHDANLHVYSPSGERLGRYRVERGDGDVPSIRGLASGKDGISLQDDAGNIYRVPLASLLGTVARSVAKVAAATGSIMPSLPVAYARLPCPAFAPPVALSRATAAARARPSRRGRGAGSGS